VTNPVVHLRKKNYDDDEDGGCGGGGEYDDKKMDSICFLLLAQQPLVGQGLLIHEVSRSHTTTHHSR
jgi:hypothetical protein